MTTGDQLLTDAIPHAAALVCAVADKDAADVQEILTALDTPALYALAVLLAANVPEQAPLGNQPRIQLTPEQEREKAIRIAAQLFDTDRTQILTKDRSRNVLDARACAMTACRMVGQTSVEVGRFFGLDHSTVLNAGGRVGENAHLRRVTAAIADQIGDRSLITAAEEVPA